MRPVNLKPPIERRAQTARRSSRLLAQGLGSKASPPGCGHFQTKNPRTDRSRVLGVPIRNGDSPVASAFSIRSGATPRGPIHTNTPLPNQPSEPDISTLLGLGRFYFAATERKRRLTTECFLGCK